MNRLRCVVRGGARRLRSRGASALALLAALVALSASWLAPAGQSAQAQTANSGPNSGPSSGPNSAPNSAPAAGGTAATADLAKATFAGGCFWCMEAPFDKLKGVVSTTSGYTGGKKDNPTYEQVSAGTTGHTESVQIVYDPKQVNFEKLLEVYWLNIDPTVKDRQFCDRGSQYRPEIFVQDEAQRQAAERSRQAISRDKPFAAPIVVDITTASRFWPAEDYHQDYYLKNPLRYKYYRNGCGRDARLKELWGEKAGGGTGH